VTRPFVLGIRSELHQLHAAKAASFDKLRMAQRFNVAQRFDVAQHGRRTPQDPLPSLLPVPHSAIPVPQHLSTLPYHLFPVVS